MPNLKDTFLGQGRNEEEPEITVSIREWGSDTIGLYLTKVKINGQIYRRFFTLHLFKFGFGIASNHTLKRNDDNQI